LTRATAALRSATGAESVYVYVFDHPHLRRDLSVDFPLLPGAELRAVADRVRSYLA
jgi:hypothetical protein